MTSSEVSLESVDSDASGEVIEVKFHRKWYPLTSIDKVYNYNMANNRPLQRNSMKQSATLPITKLYPDTLSPTLSPKMHPRYSQSPFPPPKMPPKPMKVSSIQSSTEKERVTHLLKEMKSEVTRFGRFSRKDTR